MRIPNKFNGYSADNRRLYYDPVTLAALATTGTGAAMGTGAALGTAAAGTALGTGIATGTALATGAGTALATGAGGAALGSAAIPGLVGSANTLAGASALAPTIAPAASTLGQTAGLEAAKQQIISQGANTLANQQGLASVNNIASAAGNNAANYGQITDAFTKSMGNNFPQLGPKLAGPADPTAMFSQAGPSSTTPLTETLRNTNTMMNGPANMSYGSGSQGIAANSAPINPTAYTSPIKEGATWSQNLGNLAKNPSFKAAGEYAMEHPLATGIGAYGLGSVLFAEDEAPPPPQHPGMIRPYTMDRQQNQQAYSQQASNPSDSSEKVYFTDTYTAGTPYEAPGPEYKKASGGIARYAVGGPIEMEARKEAIGNNSMYPQAQFQTPMYSNSSTQRPMTADVVNGNTMNFALGGFAKKEPEQDKVDRKYSYDPESMKYTKTTTTTPAEKNPYAMIGLTGFGGTYQDRLGFGGTRQKAAPQTPIVTTETQGGIAAPYIPRQQASQMPPMQMNTPSYQSPEQQLGLENFYSSMDSQLNNQPQQNFANGGMADGGYNLGGYSDGGRLLKGPGDGVSDSIPASIGNKQPARLADGEFVIPARIVSELGNGSTDAGARRLYAMMDKVQANRKKSIGKKKVAVDSKSHKFLPK